MSPVAPDLHEADGCARSVPDRRDGQLDLEPAAIPPVVRDEPGPGLAAYIRSVHGRVGLQCGGVAPQDGRERPADRLGRRESGDTLEGGVHELDDALRVGDGYRVRRLLDRGGQADPLGLEALPLGHVALDRHVARDHAGLVADRRDDGLFLEQAAVLAPVDEVPNERLPARQGRPHRGVEGGALDAALEDARVLAEDLGGRVAGHLLEGRVDVLDRAARVRDHDGVRGLFDHGGQAPHLALGVVAPRDVADNRDPARDGASNAADRLEDDLETMERAVGESMFGLGGPVLSGAHTALHGSDRRGIEADRHNLPGTAPDQLGGRPAHAARVRGVGVDDPHIGVGDDNAVGRLFDGRSQPLPFAGQLLPVSDVAGGDDKAIAEFGGTQVEHPLERSAGRIGVRVSEGARLEGEAGLDDLHVGIE